MKRYGLLFVLVGTLCASAALADLIYDWIEQGVDVCWTTQDNWDWDHSVNAHYPGAADTARIGYPYAGGSWTCGLETKDVAWLEIWDNVTFEACETSPILTADVVSIVGPDEEDEYVTVELTGGRIVTSEN
jgi:hypothetical protein